MRSHQFVHYSTPIALIEKQPVRADGTLDTLRLMADFLSQWCWPPQQGTVFILSGLVPYSQAYAEQVSLERGGGHRRPRPMSLKHLELAVYTARCFSGRLSLAERIARWNAEHPEWSYGDDTEQFASDSSRDLRRMG
jgi:hypothetical protein